METAFCQFSAERWFGWLGVFNATFNNILAISWWSVLLVEESGENHRPCKSLPNFIT
jgi:hypothetical protein